MEHRRRGVLIVESHYLAMTGEDIRDFLIAAVQYSDL
jgi:hypothetical protein